MIVIEYPTLMDKLHFFRQFGVFDSDSFPVFRSASSLQIAITPGENETKRCGFFFPVDSLVYKRDT